MEFDHKEPGTKSFWILQRAGSVSRDRLLTELSKCEVVCANCHRARTYARAIERREDRLRGGHNPRRESRLRREQTALIQALRARACMDCGRRFPFYVMDFDHRVPGEKAFEITRMLGRTSTEDLLDEIAKCDIVCANCHRERTFRWRSKNAGVA
jgi:5-methylcytosine-specific restriction endonuclease McrA